MSLHTDKDLERLENNKEVIERSPLEPLDAPVKAIENGPLYRAVEEVMPELSEACDEPAVLSESLNDDDKLPVDRRDFMRLFSAGAILASTACVRRPTEKAIPYVTQPIDQVPGKPVHYATTCGECASGCGFVVKTREGRVVKIEGNPQHPLSQGSTCALGQSGVQALYHPDRRATPLIRFGNNRAGEASWDDVFERLAAVLKDAKNPAIMASGSTGNRNEFFRQFLKNIGGKPESLYIYESQTLFSELAAAHKAAFGVDGIPRTELRNADFIVGVGAEFLDVGISTVYETKSWSAGQAFRHGAKGRMIQFESRLTNTGAKASQRYPIVPGDELAVLLALCEALAKESGLKASAAEVAEINKVVSQQAQRISEMKSRLKFDDVIFSALAKDLLTKRSIVMAGGSGANDENSTLVQMAAIMANVMIGAYGKTLSFDKGWMNSPVKPGDLARFFKDASGIDALIVVDTNPAFTLPATSGIKDVLKGIQTVVSIQSMPCETDEYATFVLNGNNYLESWGDEHTVAGFWSLRQPSMRAFTNSRQAEDILLWTAAAMNKPMGYREYRDFLMEKWKPVHKLVGAEVDFDTFFKAVQRRGFVGKLEERGMPKMGGVAAQFKPSETKAAGLKLVAHLDNNLIDGRGADRPLLQEAGDAMTSIAWDTWVGINPNKAKELGLRYNDVVRVEGPGGSFEASIYPFPGLHPDTIAVPRGNGHVKGISRATDGIGVDPLVALASVKDVVTGDFSTSGQSVKLVSLGRKNRLAAMQKSGDLGNRTDIVKTISLAQARAGEGKTKDLDAVPDLYGDLYKDAAYRWGMSIDLDKCTGCSACYVACSVENNVPTVGREQVLLGREMHWIRTDRYFAGSVDNPTVMLQPMLCQHCTHAPCEAVCPVFATTHDEEGINSQTYNRCVGTRYCANACPYKIRRFNWFTHKWNIMGENPLDRNPRALNPDVTVRTRGVMEKCTFCIQRIRDAKHAAKERGGSNAKVMDGEIRVACEQACPSDAIIFGNLLDPQSRVSQLRRDNRAYLALGGEPEHGHYGIKTLPNVSYLAIVSNDGTETSAMKGHGEDQGAADPHGHGGNESGQEHGHE